MSDFNQFTKIGSCPKCGIAVRATTAGVECQCLPHGWRETSEANASPGTHDECQREIDRIRAQAIDLACKASRLSQERDAYRQVAASLYEWRWQRDEELMDKWDGESLAGDEVDAEVRRILQEKTEDKTK